MMIDQRLIKAAMYDRECELVAQVLHLTQEIEEMKRLFARAEEAAPDNRQAAAKAQLRGMGNGLDPQAWRDINREVTRAPVPET